MANAAPAGVYLTIVRRPAAPAAPSARAQAAIEARKQMDQAQTEFARAYTQATLANPLNADLRLAHINLAKARQEHTRQLTEAKAALYARPHVKQVQVAIEDHEARLRTEKDIEKRHQLAMELLALRRQRSMFESETFGMDANITVAQAGVQEAINNLRMMEQQYQWELTRHPGYMDARTRLEATRERLARGG